MGQKSASSATSATNNRPEGAGLHMSDWIEWRLANSELRSEKMKKIISNIEYRSRNIKVKNKSFFLFRINALFL
jgi:hypothetical protein